MKQPSHNTRRAADESADEKNKAESNLMDCKIREAILRADPNWTAVIIKSDDKTLIMKWVRKDEINNKML